MKLFEAWSLSLDLVLTASPVRSAQTETGRWSNHLAPILGQLELCEIKSRDILSLEADLRKKKLAPQTIYHCLSLLRRILNRAVEWGLYPGPVPKIRMPKFNNKRVRFLSRQEAESLLYILEEISPLWHDICALCTQYGHAPWGDFSRYPGPD